TFRNFFSKTHSEKRPHFSFPVSSPVSSSILRRFVGGALGSEQRLGGGETEQGAHDEQRKTARRAVVFGDGVVVTPALDGGAVFGALHQNREFAKAALAARRLARVFLHGGEHTAHPNGNLAFHRSTLGQIFGAFGSLLQLR